jgi:hypothetical protein
MESGFRCPACGRLHFDVPDELLRKPKCWLDRNGKRRKARCGQCQVRGAQDRARYYYLGEGVVEEIEADEEDDDWAIGEMYWDQLWNEGGEE